MDTGDLATPRWVQRFENFDRALILLREGVEMVQQPGTHNIVKEGAIQRFEYTFELAWKTLKDYLVAQKIPLDRLGPADVIRAAFAANIIAGGQDWMDALDARNEMSHMYRQAKFDKALQDVQNRFLPRFEDFHEMLMLERFKLSNG